VGGMGWENSGEMAVGKIRALAEPSGVFGLIEMLATIAPSTHKFIGKLMKCVRLCMRMSFPQPAKQFSIFIACRLQFGGADMQIKLLH